VHPHGSLSVRDGSPKGEDPRSGASAQPTARSRRETPTSYPGPRCEPAAPTWPKNDMFRWNAGSCGFTLDQGTAHAGRVPWFLNGVRPALALGYVNGKEPQAPAFSERGRLRRSEAKASRQSRDRLKGQPQERQHSAAEGGTRDRLPPASDSRATSRSVGINFAFVIWSQCCACRYTTCACSLSQFFYRGRHGQESEEGKEDREGSHQEGGKEDFKEKEVVVSATERLRLGVATRTQSKTSPKDMKRPL